MCCNESITRSLGFEIDVVLSVELELLWKCQCQARLTLLTGKNRTSNKKTFMSLLQGVEKIIPPNAFQISSAEVIQNSHSFSEMDEIERRIESAPEPQIFQWYMRFQMWKPGPLLIVLWWFCIILVGVFYGFKLLGLTVFSFSAPPGTEGHTADVMMSKELGDKAYSRQLLIYYNCEECGN